jgi:trehalose 6-phosphate phosphatase
VGFFGDDLGDVPAFAELARLRAEDGVDAVGVAVIDEETAPEVAARADLSVVGPQGALEVLEFLAAAAAGGPG